LTAGKIPIHRNIHARIREAVRWFWHPLDRIHSSAIQSLRGAVQIGGRWSALRRSRCSQLSSLFPVNTGDDRQYILV
jgi:hypothetical protein